MKESISIIMEIRIKTKEKLVPKKQIRRIWEPITLAECIMQKEKHPKKQKDHFELDMMPYYSYGNVSKNDLPNLFEQMSNSNANRYNDNYDAKNSRNKFEKQWKGIKE